MALATRCFDCKRRTRGSRCPDCLKGRRDWTGARKIGSGWEWSRLRAGVHARDGACVRCGSRNGLQVHHRIPLARGGGNDLLNLELLCSRCHAASHRYDEDGTATVC